MIIAVNYLGAFLGTIAFAFVLYPFVGLVATAFMVALSNAVVGVLLLTQARNVDRAPVRQFHAMPGLAAVMSLVIGYCPNASSGISEAILKSYLT